MADEKWREDAMEDIVKDFAGTRDELIFMYGALYALEYIGFKTDDDGQAGFYLGDNFGAAEIQGRMLDVIDRMRLRKIQTQVLQN